MTRALLSGYTTPNQTQSCVWNEPKANTVKNSKLNPVHELLILPGQHGGILSPLCFGSFVILASALHGKVFIGHEIKFTSIKQTFVSSEGLHSLHFLEIQRHNIKHYCIK